MSAVGIFVGIVLIALVILGAIFGYKRYKDNRSYKCKSKRIGFVKLYDILGTETRSFY